MQVYVHALTDVPAPPIRIGGHTIEFVEVGGICAAIERLDAPPSLSEASLREQHDVAIGIAAALDAVLPARFGSFCDLDELERLIDLRRDPIRVALELVRGREQMTVRFAGDAVPEPSAGVTPGAISGAQYLRARHDALARRLPAGLNVLRAAVAPMVVSERVEPAEGRMPATVYHLIGRGTAAAYREAVAGIQPRLEGAMTLSGPWPPFAFAPELLP